MAGLVAAFVLAGCSPNVLDLDVGTCFDDDGVFSGGDAEVSEVSDVPIVDCAEPHDNEVYHVEVVGHPAFPGAEAMATQADEICWTAFEPFVGTDYLESELDFGWLIPTAESWERGDREVVCFLYRLDAGKMTGTMRGGGI
jgi:hypothetical protein